MKQNSHELTRAVKLLHNMDKKYIPFLVLHGALKTLSFYLPILILAEVLDGVLNGAEFSQLITSATLQILGKFLLQLILLWVEKTVQVKSQHLSYYFETLLSRKTLTIDYVQLESQTVRELQNRIKSDRSWGSGFFGITANLQNLIDQGANLVLSVIILLPLLVHTISTGNFLAVSIVFVALLISIINARFFDHWHSIQEAQAMENMTAVEMKSRFQYLNEGGGALGYRDIKDALLYKAVRLLEPTLHKEEQQIRTCTNQISGLNTFSGIIKGALTGLMMVICIGGVTWCALLGQISAGLIIQYAQSIFQLANGLAAFFQIRTELEVDAGRLKTTMDYLELKEEKSEGVLPPASIHSIEFCNVSFSYPGANQKALDHVNLKIDSKKRTAIVGLNGSGKTTLIKLICRLYQPDEGQILIDGQDIQTFDQQAYRDLLGVVFQDFSLLSLPLGNIIAANETYRAEEVRESLAKAGISETLFGENGLDTILYKDYADDGRDISGGEAQKLAIARAIYKNAPLVILDEPTAALDPKSEMDIYTSFDHLVGKKGVIYISHRLASCQFCDKIIVMGQGRVMEEGSHLQLLQNNGQYSKLWTTQAQLFGKLC